MNSTISDSMPSPQSGYWSFRRTIRRFTDRYVPQQLLTDLVGKAAKAPTTGGMQLYSVIVSRQPELLAALSEQHFNQPAAREAKVMLTIVADFNRFDLWCRQRGAKPEFDNFESFTAALLDAVIFAQQLNTLLEISGLGVCYLGTTTYNASKIGSLLKLPRLTVPVVTLAIGYPADEGTEAERLPVEAVMHDETYRDYTPEIIDALFREKEEIEENRRFVAENNVATLAHVFTDVRYPGDAARIFSKDFFDYINKQGFHFPDK